MSITQTLGRIGTEAAIRAVIGKGLPLLENNAFNITAVAQALENPIEAKAEQWLLKAGLRSASLRRNAVVWKRGVSAVADFMNPQRVAFLTREIMTSKSPETLVVILNSLENVKDKKVVSIAGKLVKHKDPGVQVAAMSLLYNQGGSREKKLFEKGLKNRAWQVRLLSLRTLARLKHKKISDYAIAALDDPDDKVQVNAVRILLDQGGREIILPLIRHIDKARGRVKDDVVDALTRLTGKDLGPSTFQWEGWWEQKGQTVKIVARCSAEEFTRMKQKLAEETNTVSYHGLRVLSDNFIFIFDSSESMKEQYVPPE
ncbi:MAG: HEAT repeat domain-containing protein, partial [Planctomycetes bacterium]|nr:HEAT repeat domain-containing protein [Planctomycetota bacterium]